MWHIRLYLFSDLSAPRPDRKLSESLFMLSGMFPKMFYSRWMFTFPFQSVGEA